MLDQPNQSNRLLPSIPIFVPTNSPPFPHPHFPLACLAGRRVLTKTHKKMVIGDITDSVFRSYVLTLGEPAMSAMVLRLKQAGINTQVLQVHSPLLLAFHPIHPWFPLSCLLSTPSAPGSLSPACFPPHPPLVPPLLLAFHPIRPWFPLSCLLSTPSAPGSPSPACFPPHPPLVPPLLLAFHPIHPWFPLSCLLSTPSTPGSPSPACFPPHPPLVPPLQTAVHANPGQYPISLMLSTPSFAAFPFSLLNARGVRVVS
ncbi:unnamed protein product [Closterium sp. Naga37s-1]|nr:unnamed protein product [Closterium sp. Naga37s-1]